jgi:hypothetical protein
MEDENYVNDEIGAWNCSGAANPGATAGFIMEIRNVDLKIAQHAKQ